MNNKEEFDINKSEDKAKLQEAELGITELADESVDKVTGGCECTEHCSPDNLSK